MLSGHLKDTAAWGHGVGLSPSGHSRPLAAAGFGRLGFPGAVVPGGGLLRVGGLLGFVESTGDHARRWTNAPGLTARSSRADGTPCPRPGSGRSAQAARRRRLRSLSARTMPRRPVPGCRARLPRNETASAAGRATTSARTAKVQPSRGIRPGSPRRAPRRPAASFSSSAKELPNSSTASRCRGPQVAMVMWRRDAARYRLQWVTCVNPSTSSLIANAFGGR